jgi:ribosomal protein L9
VKNLGFRGETVFVKPGYAFNELVPGKKALFATDPDATKVTVDVLLE